MWPTLVDVVGPNGPIRVHTYGVLVLLAFTVGFALVHARSRHVGIEPERLVPAYVAAAFGGLLGARVLYAVAVGDPGALVGCSGGFAYYGGLIGGAAAVIALTPVIGVDGWKLADVVFPVLVLGNAIGRLGCFFAGCCHGGLLPAGASGWPLLPEGMLQGQLHLHGAFPFLSNTVHAGVGRLHDVPIYPTQLWSVVGGILIAAVGMSMWRTRRFDGQVAAAMLMVEPVMRITVEAFRADHRGYAVSWWVSDPPAWLQGMASAGASLPGSDAVQVGLTTSQGIGLLIMAVGAGIHLVRRNRGVAPETPVAVGALEELV